MVKLGSKVRDLITGVTGFATARSEWLYGCTRIRVEGPDNVHEGKPQELWFDEQRIEVTQENAVPVGEAPSCPIELGAKVRDKVTGFSGIASARTVWTGGEITVTIEPDQLRDGKTVEAQSFPYQRIELVEAKKPPMSANANPAAPGGPKDDPKQPVARRRQ